jgi:hypothetical protein
MVIRIISNATYNAHTAPLFTNLHIMPYSSIIKHAKLKIMHSYHYKYISASFAGTWQTNAERTGHAKLRNADDYHIPLARTNHLDKFPLFSIPREWNMARPAKFHRNALTFKIELKNELWREMDPLHAPLLPPSPPPLTD